MPTSSGTLRIRIYTAGGALPVEGAIVRIRGADEDNGYVVHQLVTDIDGLTPAISLPAPSADYSLFPDPSEQPFASYNIEISANGFLDKKINGLTVFSGIESIQLVNMIPGNQNNQSTKPNGGSDAVIPPNYNLY